MEIETIEVNRICLDLENPRHEPYEREHEAIQYLCQSEKTSTLARDIVEHGLNPLELFAVIPEGDGLYVAAEGNRRLCALKLLLDPEQAPGRKKADFRKLAEAWKNPTTSVFAVVFSNRDEVRLWLERTHGGEDQGRGRIAWNPEQKTRFTGAEKNALAQQLLDAAEKEGIITTDQRKRKLSTVQRYSSNPIMRDEVLWLSKVDGVFKTRRSPGDFLILLERFIGDVAKGEINTRADKAKIKKYADRLRSECSVREEEVDAWAVTDRTSEDSEEKPKREKRTRKLIRIAYSENLYAALQETRSYKLQEIYRSLHSISAREHTPLLALGVWAFVETLTALEGRNEGASFPSYLNADKLGRLSMGTKTNTKEVRDALQRLSDMGNATKHQQKAAAFNDAMLIIDFGIAEEVLVALAREIEAAKA